MPNRIEMFRRVERQYFRDRLAHWACSRWTV